MLLAFNSILMAQLNEEIYFKPQCLDCYNHLKKELVYPREGIARKYEGTIRVKLTFDEEGHLKKEDFIGSISALCDKVIKNAFQSMNKSWLPAIVGGQISPLITQIEIKYALINNKPKISIGGDIKPFDGKTYAKHDSLLNKCFLADFVTQRYFKKKLDSSSYDTTLIRFLSNEQVINEMCRFTPLKFTYQNEVSNDRIKSTVNESSNSIYIVNKTQNHIYKLKNDNTTSFSTKDNQYVFSIIIENDKRYIAFEKLNTPRITKNKLQYQPATYLLLKKIMNEIKTK